MTIIRPQVILTKEDVKVVKNLGEICRIFDFEPGEVIEAIETGYGLNEVEFIYED